MVPSRGSLRSMRLELRDITKRFPGVLANDRISISADRGEVLGLLGENGAGKSTLMNILSGLYRPDSGEILIDGTSRTFTDPRQAIDAGIGMVHQHFELVPVFSVVEAVSLGAESVTGPVGTFDRTTARRRVVELSQRYNLDVNPDAKIEDLPVGVRQRVEILKALYRQSDILVLDEPSAVLTPFETEELFGIIREPGRGRHHRHLHHPQAQRGAGGRGPDHRAASRTRRRHDRAEGRDPGDPCEPDGRPGRRAHGRQGPGVAGRRGALGQGPPRARRPGAPRRRGRQPGHPGGRDRRARRRPGQRADRARGGDRGPPAGGLRRDRHRRAGHHLVVAPPGLRPRRGARARGPDARRPHRGHDGGRELHPRHLPPRAVQQAGQPQRRGHRRGRGDRREGLRRPHAVDRHPTPARSPAATSRRSSSPGSSPGR